MTLRVAFLGNDPWSVPALEALAGDPGIELVLVLTNPPRPAGRGSVLRPTAVAEVALALDAPLVEADGVREGAGADAVAAARPDVLVVVAYGQILPREILELARHGALNLHFSLLPRWRGASPVQHTLLAGDAAAGVTVMRMDEGLDTGPVLAQLEDEVRPDDDAGSLGTRLSHLGARLLVGVVLRLPDGDLPARAQGDDGVTWAPRLGPEDRELRWDGRAAEAVRRVRAFAPEPGAVTIFRGEPLKVLRAVVARDAVAAASGTVMDHDDRGVVISTGDGGVRLVEVAPSGRRRMPASDWARGARFRAGERLG